MCLFAGALVAAGCNFFMDADARVARAEEHIAAGDYRAAMIDLRNAVQAEPGHAEARRLLAEVSLQLGDPATAEKELRRAIEEGAPPQATADLAARVALALGRHGELLARIDADELPLEEPERSTYRGRALLGVGQASEAQAAFEGALEVHPHAPAARVGLAESMFAQGRADAALAELETVTEADASYAAAHLVRGTILARRGQFARAQESLTTALANGTTLTVLERITLLATLAEAQLAQGDPAAAAATHKELSALTGGDAPLTRMLAARIAMSEQDYAKATSELQRVVTRTPDFAPARFLLGAALMAQGNLNQAEMHLSRALQRAPDNLEARKLLAQVRLRLERPDAAMQVLLSAQPPMDAQDAQDAQLDLLVGLAHLQLGEAAEGIAQLERALASSADNRALRLDLAAAHARTGEHAKAMQMLKETPRLAGDLRREQLMVAVQAASQGLAAARAEVDRLVRENPRDAEILNFGALFLARQREFDGARVLLARAAEAQPDDPGTLMNRARVEVAAGDLPAATQWLQQIVAMQPTHTAVRLALADVAVRAGDLQSATRTLEELRAADAQALEPRLRLARLYLQQTQNDELEGLLKELRTLAAGQPEALNSLGLVYLEARRYEEALAQFRAATGLAEDDPGYWLNVARAELALDHGPAAREALEKALTLRPRWVPAVGALALLDLRENKRNAALARIADLKSAMPADPAALTLEGDFMMAVQDYPRAAEAYSQALERRADTATVLKTFRARQLGKLGDATVPLQAWLTQRPDDLAVRAVLAEAYQTAGQHDAAIEQYELIVENAPASVAVLNNLAWLYQQTGDGRAEATARQAYEAAPGAPAVADTYGWILVRAGKVAQGREVLEAAVAAADGHPDIEYHYAAALARSGERTEARTRLRRLLERGGRFAEKEDAQTLLQELSVP